MAGEERLREAQRFFGARVEAYRQSATHGSAPELARMIDLLRPTLGERAVDVATGGGHTARALAEAGCRVVATDATRGMLAALRGDEASARAACDAQALPFRDGVFDIVASRIAPHHFPDLRAFVRESARILSHGGRFYVFDLTTPEDPRAARLIDRIETLRDPSHVHSHPPSAWRAALDAAGLHIDVLRATASEFDLEPWIGRAALSRDGEGELRRLLAEHPPETLGGYGLVRADRMRVLRVEALARPAA